MIDIDKIEPFIDIVSDVVNKIGDKILLSDPTSDIGFDVTGIFSEYDLLNISNEAGEYSSVDISQL